MVNDQFDFSTAQPLPKGVPGTSSGACHAYVDANGAVCIWAWSWEPCGDVLLDVAALEWLDQQPGPKFVRLTYKDRAVDQIIPRHCLRTGPCIHDPDLGDYYEVGISAPPFTPLGVSPFFA